MSSKIQLVLIASMLTIAGVGLTLFKHHAFGFPLTRAGAEDVWTIEAEVSFTATGEPVRASLALPHSSDITTILRESFASHGYGFSREDANGHSRALWTRRGATGQQTFYYRLQLLHHPENRTSRESPPPEIPDRPFLEEPKLLAATTIVTAARQQSSDAHSFASQLIQMLAPDSNQNAAMLLLGVGSDEEQVDLLRRLMALEGIPTRMTRGVKLSEGRRFQPIQTGFEVWDSKSGWTYFEPGRSAAGKPSDLFLWQRGGVSLLDLEGGVNSQVRFSIIRDTRPAAELAFERAEARGAAFLNFSIYELPLEEQNVFKRLMLVPLGALVIVILRNLVGLSTSGTFMPILLALAFQETRLLPGITMFVLVVGSGLAIRSLLSHLNLLVVARVSAVVIVVIGLMAFLSILSYKLGLVEGMKVTFFPMIIIAWTIERLSILWEEEGARAAMMRGGGSLAVAIIAFVVMNSEMVRHLTYTFPELLLVVLALTLLLGSYSGYRLTELRRFLPFLTNRVP